MDSKPHGVDSPSLRLTAPGQSSTFFALAVVHLFISVTHAARYTPSMEKTLASLLSSSHSLPSLTIHAISLEFALQQLPGTFKRGQIPLVIHHPSSRTPSPPLPFTLSTSVDSVPQRSSSSLPRLHPLCSHIRYRNSRGGQQGKQVPCSGQPPLGGEEGGVLRDKRCRPPAANSALASGDAEND